MTAADTTYKGGLRELALFAGAGGGILGGKLLGWRTVCAVEFDPYARSVLLARQRDGHLDRFPIWDDVRTFDGHPWRGSVDVVSGGFPCQDISAAGKGAGIEGARSGLWGHMARIVREVRPRHVLVENSPMLTSRGLGVVLGDLASMGYDARWGVLGARHVGAPHKRDRIWIVARDADRNSEPAQPVDDEASRLPRVADSSCSRLQSRTTRTLEFTGRAEAIRASRDRRVEWWDRDPAVADAARTDGKESPTPHGIQGAVQSGGRGGDECSRGRTPESVVGRVAHGVADRVDRLRALGNGQVPAVAALAWTILSGGDP